jgi:glycosyltransferase involved in cell wall biosynthesis
VLSTRYPDQPAFEVIDGIEVERFRVLLEGRSKVGLLFESALLCLTLMVTLFRLALLSRVAAVQFCNPPDWSALVALVVRRPRTAVIFDLTDLTPLLYEAKFGSRGPLYRLSKAIFALAVQRADLVLTANDLSARYATLAARRSLSTTVPVASYLPGNSEAISGAPQQDSSGSSSRCLVVGYFGVLGIHDGVDRLIGATALIRKRSATLDFRVDIIGNGPAMSSLRQLARQEPAGSIHFHGFLQGDKLDGALRSFDVAVIPDPATRYGHSVSLNKLFVFAALGLPMVSTPLRQTKRLLGNAAQFAVNDSPEALAFAIEALLRSPESRQALSQAVRERSRTTFCWAPEADRYTSAVESLAHKAAA